MADADGDLEGRTTDTSESVDEFIARIAAHDETLAVEAAAIRDRIETLTAELEDREERIDELTSRLKRERADFKNYKKRVEEREDEIRERATENLVERLLDVRDNLVRALSQDDDVDVRDGVEATLSTFDRVLQDENVGAIEPAPGDEVDPERHEVVMRVDGDHPPGHIEDIYRPGYELAGKILRPAQVTVSEAPDEE